VSLYRDFQVISGLDATLTLYIRGDGAGTGGIVRVQCLESGHFLTSTGDWQASSADLFTVSAATFTLSSVAFDVEAEAVVRSTTATLRVTLYVDSFSATAYYDTFVLRNAANIINIPRPVFINHVNLLDTTQDPDHETPLDPLTDDGWAAIAQKDLTSMRPSAWYYNPTFPYGTLSLWPVPTGAGLQGVIYVPTQVSTFTSLETAVSLPPGYERMIVKNLALELLPSYGREPSPALVMQAAASMATVKRANHRLSDMSFDSGALIGNSRAGAWDIRSGP
jgi:hypothetical protein